MNVVVVGSGIIGASISRQLAARGAQVTVLEAGPAAAAGATGKSWAWLNANAKKPQHYRDLNLSSMQLWQQQHSDLSHFCGCLMLHDERPSNQDPLYPSQHIPPGAQLQGLEPSLNPDLAETCQHAKLYTQEGWCDPVVATAAFLADAAAAGAAVMYSQKVLSIQQQEGRATSVTAVPSNSSSSSSQPPAAGNLEQQQQQQQYAADVVVVAAGVGSSELCLQLGYRLPLLHKPAAILLTHPVAAGTVRHMLVTDTVFVLQRSDGRVLIGETQPAPASNTDTSDANAGRILAAAAAAVPALSQAAVEGMYVGYRPYPADGFPVLGWVPGCSNVYVAVSHSGMTLAPLIGQLVAEEVLAVQQLLLQQQKQQQQQQQQQQQGVTNDTGSSSRGAAASAALQEARELLAPYRPDRDIDAAVAAAAAQPSVSWAATLQPSSKQ